VIFTVGTTAIAILFAVLYTASDILMLRVSIDFGAISNWIVFEPVNEFKPEIVTLAFFLAVVAFILSE